MASQAARRGKESAAKLKELAPKLQKDELIKRLKVQSEHYRLDAAARAFLHYFILGC